MTVGTSKDAALVDRIAEIVDSAYTSVGKRKRVDREDAMDYTFSHRSVGGRFPCSFHVFLSIVFLGVPL